MRSRAEIAEYAATMARGLCEMCRQADLEDLAYLFDVAAEEAAKATETTEVNTAAGSSTENNG